MAEESISLPVYLKSTEADGRNSRRNSTGKASTSKNGEMILPHYLRASTGSCHDFCKYGRKHAFEERAPFLRRMTKKPPDDQNSIDSVEFRVERRKKTSVVKLKRCPSSETDISNTPEVIQGELSTKSIHRQTPVFSEAQVDRKTLAGALLTKSVDSKRSLLRDVLAKRKTSGQEVLTKSDDCKSSVSSEIFAEKKKTSKQGKKKTSVFKLKTSPDSKTHVSPKVIKQDVSLSSEKLKVSLKQASSKAKEVNLSARHFSALKPELSSPDASRVLNGRRNGTDNIGQGTGSPRMAAMKVQVSPRASLPLKTSVSGVARRVTSPRVSISSRPLIRGSSLGAKKHKGSKAVSPLKNQNKSKKADIDQPKMKNAEHEQPSNELKEPNNNVVQERTLYVIKMETENKYVESDNNENISVESSPPPLSSSNSPPLPNSPSLPSQNEENEEESDHEEGSEYTVTEAEDDSLSEYDETEYIKQAGSLEGEHKGIHRKAGMVPLENDGQPVKLRFRRGKMVDIESVDNGPRRLKFRRGRMLGDNQNLKAEAHVSFKRRVAAGSTNNSKPDSEKVVLRHQDVQGKKDAQGLFNNVIEETASKLVETRKSKVKALVGAFETVISLQDSKPSANIVS